MGIHHFVLRPVISLALFLASSTAFAQSNVEARLAEVEVGIDEIIGKTELLTGQIENRPGFITERDAIERYRECVYLHLIGDHKPAAEGFFGLVTTAALRGSDGLDRDAEWYLAESLFAMGTTSNAERNYRLMADDPNHPFRDDAIRRLLELYSQTRQSEQFYELYEQAIARGGVRPSPLIAYTVAKSFYQQEDLLRAKSNFLDIALDSPYYGKARYFLGTIMVAEGDLEQAIIYFQEVANLGAETIDDRQVRDLSLLALGRLYYETGRFAESTEYYRRIAGDSAVLADKLYEITWTFIKQEQFEEALRAAEIFLLAYPEHEYTAELKLLEGHLHVQQRAFDSALTSYEGVIQDYTPIRETFRELSESRDDPEQYFGRILEISSGDAAGGRGELPSYALAMMMGDEELGRAISVYQDLESQQNDITMSEQLIADLETVLSSQAGIGGFSQLRYEVQVVVNASLERQLELLELEEAWLAQYGPPSMGSDLTEFKRERLALVDDVRLLSGQVSDNREMFKTYEDQVREVQEVASQVNDVTEALRKEVEQQRRMVERGQTKLQGEDAADVLAELEAVAKDLGDVGDNARSLSSDSTRRRVMSEVQAPQSGQDNEKKLQQAIAGLRAKYRNARDRVNAPSKKNFSRSIDGLQARLAEARSQLIEAQSSIESREFSQLAVIRTRLDTEVRSVAKQRSALEGTLGDASEVSVALTRSGFGRMEGFFADSVMHADLGIVDVYWAQKVEVQDQREELLQEKNDRIKNLDERFEFIRNKMNQ